MKKKFISLILLLVLAFSLTACSDFVRGFKKGYNDAAAEDETEITEVETTKK